MFKKTLSLLALLAVVLSFSACGKDGMNPANKDLDSKYAEFVSGLELLYEGDPLAVVDTGKGMFAFEIFSELVPLTSDNFINLVDQRFYNGLKWHLVLPGTKIQTGDPTGIGTGGANVSPLKLETHPDLRHDKLGMVGMARYENNLDSATSQFYIALDEEPEWDRKYAIFGQVIKGAEVLGSIKRNDKIESIVIIK